MTDQTIICRCEDVTRDKLLEAIAEGCETIDEIKRVLRAGMGPCQGRTCTRLIARELANIYGIAIEEVLMPNFRPPAKPISIAMLADTWEEGERE
jgi:bacterioferritin-associated ferredoxin